MSLALFCGKIFYEMGGAMPKGYIVVSYRGAPNDESLSNYAPKALEAMTNAGAKFIARGLSLIHI